jgi:cation:H+ antiporter
MGNVVGSNIFNVLFILGLSALVTPLVVSQQLVRWDVPIMIGVSVLAVVFALDGSVVRLEGLALFGGMVVYTIFLIVQSRREKSALVEAEYENEFGAKPRGVRQLLLDIVRLAAGLAMLVIGSRWLVGGAAAIARAVGVDEAVIGLTIIAAGTSLPEIATSVLASVRGERDIAVGNVVGSSIFNIMGVLGLTALVAPDGVSVAPSILNLDLPLMLAAAVACLPIFFTGYQIARWEGGVFVAYYAAYTSYLILNATQHAALPGYSSVMLLFVLPLTAITLAVISVRELRARL